jgi:hypothetical protein
VANLLGSDPFNMVFSESQPPASVLLHGDWSHDDQVTCFRDTLLAMGRSPVHKRVFFKFQSITTQKMKIALEAFPDTPWVFIYRNPVQTMMSHLAPTSGNGKNARCITQSKNTNNKKVLSALEKAGTSSFRAPREALCAAHLNMLCEFALEAYEAYGKYEGGSERARGLLLDYQHLPGAVPALFLPHFGLPQAPAPLLRSMAKESLQYSKSSKRNQNRGKSGAFSGDSEDKEKRASPAIDEWAEKIMGPTYEKMGALALPVLQTLSGGADLATVRVIPDSEDLLTSEEEGASKALPQFAYEYEAFRNTHNSSRFEVCLCLRDAPPARCSSVCPEIRWGLQWLQHVAPYPLCVMRHASQPLCASLYESFCV